MLSFVAFLIALIIFVVRALNGDIDADWGFAAIAAGLALSGASVAGWVERARA